MSTIKRAVVTGGTGMIGITLIKQLLNLNIEVLAIVRPKTSKIRHLPYDKKLWVIEADLDQLDDFASDIDMLSKDKLNEFLNKWKVVNRKLAENDTKEYNVERQFKECDAFFHLGWASTFGESRNQLKIQNDNVRYTLNAVELAYLLGCKVFVGAGSQAEYGRVEYGQKLGKETPAFPENGYGIAKLCAGQLSRIACYQFGIRHVWCRILSIYGPFDNPGTMIMSGIRSLMIGKRPIYTSGEQQWDYLYVEDCANALYLSALSDKAGGVYCVGSGSVRPLHDYILILRDTIDSEAPIGLGEIPYGEHQVMYLQADITKLTEDTGFVPSISFEEGIQKTIAWCKNES